FVVDDGLARLVAERHAANPIGQASVGRSRPGVLGEVLANQLAGLFDQDAVEAVAGLQLAAGRGTNPRRPLNLVVGHGASRRCPLSGILSRAGAGKVTVGSRRAGSRFASEKL